MGNESSCTLRYAGKLLSGKALLETSELLFRGETRLKIPFHSIRKIHATGSELHVHTKEGLAIFELGRKAAAWHQKISRPKSVLEKLGVRGGQSVSLYGEFSSEFRADLKKRGAKIVHGKIAKDSPWIFLAAEERSDLRGLPAIARQIQGATALWLVYPKGQKSVTESDIRSAGLETGLVDVKVVGFSPTHTALKFVLPKSRR